MDVAAYLHRIGYDGPREATAETLRRLHRAHMVAVPFENLDIHLGRPIVLSLPLLFEKIVGRRRGGFCYELNGLFAWLLQELGFSMTMHAARVFDEGQPGPDFDHMTLLVGADDKILADVGFGDSFLDPQPFDAEARDPYGRSYRLVEREGKWVLQQRKPEAVWEPQYVFSMPPRRLDEFEAMCHYQQTSPESHFTQKSVCSRATPDGRVTLANGRLIVTAGGRREERAVVSVDEYRTLLRAHFGFDLEDEAPVDRLMQPNVAAE